MSGAIHKPGQGYWVRALSAVFFGAIALAAAGWGWGQAGAYDLPVGSYQLTIVGVEGQPQPGQSLTLLVESPTREGVFEPIGQAVVQAADPLGQGYQLRLQRPTLTDPAADPRDSARLRAGDAESPSLSAGVLQGSVLAIPVFPRVYLQAAVAGLIALLGSIAIYWFIALSPRAVDFLIATQGEMNKVNWSTRREIFGSTWVVIVAAFLIAALLFVIDSGFAAFFQAIRVIES